MSRVSNSVIVASAIDSQIPHMICAKDFAGGVSSALVQRFERIDMDECGGSKWFESDVFGAAFNYVSETDIIAWFESLPWMQYDTATLTIHGNDTDYVSVVMGGKVVLSDNAG